MSNENKVYYIEDIHPRDSYYEDRKYLIGRKVYVLEIVEVPMGEGWVGVYCDGVEGEESIGCFSGVKLTKTPPKKPFWQKLFTWSW